MSGEVAIVCSRADPASLNIFERLLELKPWQEEEGYWFRGAFRLLVHDEKQSALSGPDKRLADLGLHPEMVIFPCRHEAKAALPWFGGHFTGILQEMQDGHGQAQGQSQLSAAAPAGLRSFLHNIAALSLPGYIVSAEATHHGPVDMKTPCFFAEIGSTKEQWTDRKAGEAVARAIMALQPEELPVFLGFGGGHYVQRQTELIFGSAIAFGHLFSTYQVGGLNREVVDDARSKSNAAYAYLDRKSLRSDDRKRIGGILEELDLPMLRSREIRAQFPV